jgi:hypothetical protein
MTTAKGRFARIPGLALQGMPLLAAAAVAVLVAIVLADSVFAGLMLGAVFTAVVVVPVYFAALLNISAITGRLLAPPGIPLTVLIAVSLGILAIALSAPWDALLGLAVGFLLWALAGTIWLVKLGLVLVREGASSVRGRWRRWLFPFVLGVLGFALAVSGASFTLRFELSRPALDGAANQARAGDLSPSRQVQLGLFSGELETRDPGNVAFFVGLSWTDAYYFVQLPDGTRPVSDEDSTWSHIGGHWWLNDVVTSR